MKTETLKRLCIGSLGLLSPLASGCNSSPATTSGSAGLAINFSPMYSAFDGTHTFKVPAQVTGVTGATWTSSDASAVDIAADTAHPGRVMITTKKAGIYTITATAGSLSGTSTLTVASATSDYWTAGSERYNNGVVQHPPGGRPSPSASPAPTGPATNLACTNCHGGTGRQDIEHTPTQTGGYSDTELVTIFTQGQKPEGVPYRVMPATQFGAIHKWTMTADEQKGLVIYLRALEPKDQGALDFGGDRGPGRGMGAPPTPSASPASVASDMGTGSDASH